MENKPEFRREISELSLLFEISQTLDQSIDLREVVHPVLELIAERTGMIRGTLTLLNRETKRGAAYYRGLSCFCGRNPQAHF